MHLYRWKLTQMFFDQLHHKRQFWHTRQKKYSWSHNNALKILKTTGQQSQDTPSQAQAVILALNKVHILLFNSKSPLTNYLI
jgi:hypothetical protein